MIASNVNRRLLQLRAVLKSTMCWCATGFNCILYWFYYRQNTTKSCYPWLQDCHIL